MKREQVIRRLVEVGRNPKHLEKFSNAELQAALVIERPKLEAIEQQKVAKANEVTRARQACEQQQREIQQRPFREAAYRQKPWLKPIVAHKTENALDRREAGRLAFEADKRYNHYSHIFRETGDRHAASEAAKALLEKNSMERYLRALHNQEVA